MKVIHRNEILQNPPGTRRGFVREHYFFYEKNTGVAHFHVEAAPDGSFPAEQAAGLLAMHCMVRGQSPDDYVVMVEADPQHLGGIREKTEKLLQAGQAVKCRVRLTRREEEVLNGVMRSLANKEIANSLNLSERTVKFHVSSLLAKFRVRGRMELVREAARHSAPITPMPMPLKTREAVRFAENKFRRPLNRDGVLPLAQAPMVI